MNTLFNIKDLVVVITGGTGILGRAIAKYLAAEGAKVVIIGRKAVVGEAIVSEIREAGGEALFLTTNVLDQAAVQLRRGSARIDVGYIFVFRAARHCRRFAVVDVRRVASRRV